MINYMFDNKHDNNNNNNNSNNNNNNNDNSHLLAHVLGEALRLEAPLLLSGVHIHASRPFAGYYCRFGFRTCNSVCSLSV